MVNGRGKGVFYSPMILSQSFSGPVFLGCGFPKCFSVLELELDISSSPAWLRCYKILIS